LARSVPLRRNSRSFFLLSPLLFPVLSRPMDFYCSGNAYSLYLFPSSRLSLPVFLPRYITRDTFFWSFFLFFFSTTTQPSPYYNFRTDPPYICLSDADPWGPLCFESPALQMLDLVALRSLGAESILRPFPRFHNRGADFPFPVPITVRPPLFLVPSCG